MSKLTEIYTSILRFSGLDADDQGYISTVLDDKRDPAFINGLRMVLPHDHQLRGFNPKEKIIFHPLTENILRGESEVITKLKSVINIRLNFTIGIVAQSLLNLVASPELHHRMSPEQAELLTSITDCDDKTVMNFISQMVNGMKNAPDRIFSNIYLKRGGTFKGKRYSRVGVVSFPFFQQLAEDKIDKIRVKDKETFKQLFEFMFPELNEPEEYNYGSDSNIAPYLEALMMAAALIASRLNDLLLIYKDFIDDADKVMFDSEWIDYIKDLNALIPEIRKVPVQFGNDGVTTVSVDEPEKVEVSVPTAYQPVQQQQYPVAAQQQPIQQQAPELRKTKRGLDFQSVVNTNPTVAMTPNPLAPQMMVQQWQQAQMQQQPLPSWAAPQQQMPNQGVGQLVQTAQGPAFATPQGLVPAIQTQMGWVPAVVAPNGQLVPAQMMAPQQPMGYGAPQGGMAPTPTWAYR